MPEMNLSEKSAAVEIKTNSTPGEFTAIISAIGNVDRQGDKVMPGAFEKAMSEDPVPPVYWAHQHTTPPIGEGLEWSEKSDAGQVIYKGRLFVKGDVEHPTANAVYAGMKSYDGRPPAIRQFSYTYGVPDGGAERVLEDGKAIRLLHEVRPVAEVGPCFIGANAATGLLEAAKAVDLTYAMKGDSTFDAFDFFQLGSKATWDQAYVDSLPDSAFLYVEPGGSKKAGKTEPLAARHFPYKDAQGQIDMPHLRDAIDRAPQSALADDVKNRVQNRARRLLRAQEGKALLLTTLYSSFGSKAWDDIEGYEVQQILEMLDGAICYIQMEEDPGDVAQMQTIAQQLIKLLQAEFDEAVSGDQNDASPQKAAFSMAVKAYEDATESPVLSERDSTLRQQEIARLLLLGPTH